MTLPECLAELGFWAGAEGWWRGPRWVAVRPRTGEVMYDCSEPGGGCVEFPCCLTLFDLLTLLRLLGAVVPGDLHRMHGGMSVEEAEVWLDDHKRWWLELGQLPLRAEVTGRDTV